MRMIDSCLCRSMTSWDESNTPSASRWEVCNCILHSVLYCYNMSKYLSGFNEAYEAVCGLKRHIYHWEFSSTSGKARPNDQITMEWIFIVHSWRILIIMMTTFSSIFSLNHHFSAMSLHVFCFCCGCCSSQKMNPYIFVVHLNFRTAIIWPQFPLSEEI